KTVTAASGVVYSGHATNACGAGSEAIAELKIEPGGTESLSTSSSSIQQGQSTAVTVTLANIGSWSLSSALGNPLSDLSGTGSRTVTYTGTHTGTDTVTL